MAEFPIADIKKALTESVIDLNGLKRQIEVPVESPVNYASIFRDHRMADYSYEVVMERIKEFEENLDDQHEVAVKLASFGQSVTLSVTDIGFSNPSTLVFYGFVGDQRAELIQHMSQLNFLLLSVQKADPEKPPRRIGFEPPSED